MENLGSATGPAGGFGHKDICIAHPGPLIGKTGRFCFRDMPGLADICLFAQVLNNRRFDVDMAPYPVINRIFAALERIGAFARAAPDLQPDAP